jgi:hypothetical protein
MQPKIGTDTRNPLWPTRAYVALVSSMERITGSEWLDMVVGECSGLLRLTSEESFGEEREVLSLSGE